MGIYYAEDGSFTSTLDVIPKTFLKKNYNKQNKDNYYNKYEEYDDNYYLNLDISYSDFIRVCNLLNSDKKDKIAAIIIQKWWKHIKHKRYKKNKSAAIIIQRWWRNIKKNKNKKFSIWNFLLFL